MFTSLLIIKEDLNFLSKSEMPVFRDKLILIKENFDKLKIFFAYF